MRLLPFSSFHDDISTPATTIAPKHTINIIERRILLRAHKSTGKALRGVTSIVLPSGFVIGVHPYSIHLPTNGTLVYNCIPQQLLGDG